MRRFPLLLAVLIVVAVACGDDADVATGDGPTTTVAATTSSSAPATTTTTSVTSTTATPTSSLSTTTTTTVSQGMCGDLIPVVTESGTNCVDPDAPIDGPAGFPDLLIAEDGDLSLYSYDDEMLRFESRLSADHPVTAIHQTRGGVIFTRESRRIDETEQVIDLAADRSLGEHARRLLEARGRDEALGRERSLRDTE